MALHVELADEHYHTCQQLGIAFTDGTATKYVPFDVAVKSDVLRRWLEDATKVKYMADSKASQAALKREGIRLAGVDFDLLLASYINNPALSGDDVATLAKDVAIVMYKPMNPFTEKEQNVLCQTQRYLQNMQAVKPLLCGHYNPSLRNYCVKTNSMTFIKI